MSDSAAQATRPDLSGYGSSGPAWAIVVALVLLPAFYWEGGLLDEEAGFFVVHYLGDESVLAKIFHPQVNDWGLYQGRELAYAFDYLDAQVYAWLLERGVFLLIPLSALLSSLLLVAVFQLGVRYALPRLDAITALAATGLLLSSFVFVSTMGMFYRSGKPLLAPALVGLLFTVLHTDRQRAGAGPQRGVGPLVSRRSVGVFLLCLTMGLLDRQGYFYTLAACALLALQVARRRRLLDLLVAAVLAALCTELYNRALGPYLIHAHNGYWPSFAYQTLDYAAVLREPALLWKAAELLWDNTVLLFGGAGPIGPIAVAGGLVVLLRRSLRARRAEASGEDRGRDAPGWRGPALYAAAGLGLYLCMFALMIQRHPWIYDEIDHRYWYYPLGYLAAVVFGLLVLLEAIVPALDARARRIVLVALVALGTSNLLQLGHYRDVTLGAGQWYARIYRQTQLLRESLRVEWPDRRLHKTYRLTYEHYVYTKAADQLAKRP